ncbi:MAG: response regulator [Myxococcaceae bacterium]|nr:response regulator [Myxococcaceae bacterium]
MASESDTPPIVLVVDDEPDIRRLVRLMLGPSYQVLEAADANEAIALVAANDVEVAIVDVMMPGKTGFEALPLMREKAKRRLAVLFLTALNDQEHRNLALEAGADDYLAKPVDRRELALRVQHFVRLGRQERLIREQLEALSQLQALKDDLVAMLVHDLRNPLTAVTSVLQMLEPKIPEHERGLFLLGQKAVQRVLTGVNDLLKVRMLERGELPLERAPVDAASLVKQVTDTMAGTALSSKLELASAVPAGITLSADAQLLTRALENLVANALRHTKDRVDLEVTQHGGSVSFVVHDRGPGVPDFLKAELFDMFGSVALKKAGGRRGHGLGLYLVRLVARAHGGEVTVRDREGGGASFELTVPAGPST